MSFENSEKNVWFLEGPFFRYEGNVKDDARKAGVRIVDSRYASEEMVKALSAPKTPKATLKKEYLPKQKEE